MFRPGFAGMGTGPRNRFVHFYLGSSIIIYCSDAASTSAAPPETSLWQPVREMTHLLSPMASAIWRLGE